MDVTCDDFHFYFLADFCAVAARVLLSLFMHECGRCAASESSAFSRFIEFLAKAKEVQHFLNFLEKQQHVHPIKMQKN